MNEPYTTPESVYGYLGVAVPSESSDEYAEMEKWILAMSAWMDRYCNRTLYRTEEETVKYDGDGTDLMVIDDVIDPVVTIDGVERPVLGYPQRKDYVSRIVLENGYKFTTGRQNIEVTGVHSMYLYLPAEIQHACDVLVAGIYNSQQVQDKAGTTERMGDYSVTYREKSQISDFTNAKTLLSGLRRIAL